MGCSQCSGPGPHGNLGGRQLGKVMLTLSFFKQSCSIIKLLFVDSLKEQIMSVLWHICVCVSLLDQFLSLANTHTQSTYICMHLQNVKSCIQWSNIVWCMSCPCQCIFLSTRLNANFEPFYTGIILILKCCWITFGKQTTKAQLMAQGAQSKFRIRQPFSCFDNISFDRNTCLQLRRDQILSRASRMVN